MKARAQSTELRETPNRQIKTNAFDDNYNKNKGKNQINLKPNIELNNNYIQILRRTVLTQSKLSFSFIHSVIICFNSLQYVS
jgi:hypothetical protein